MKKVLIISGSSLITYYLTELRKYFKGKIVFDKYSWHQICFKINQGKVAILKDGQPFENYDLVWIRGTKTRHMPIAISLARVLSKKGIKIASSAWVDNLVSNSKLISLTELALNNFPIPDSLACLVEQALICQKMIAQDLGLPLIIKDSMGMQGKKVYLIKDRNNLDLFIKKYSPNKILIFQKYIENGKDHRVLVMGNRPLAWEVRIKFKEESPEKRFWDKKEIYQAVSGLPEKMREISLQSARALKLEIAGVDILEDTQGKYWLLEVNRTPGISSEGKNIEDIKAAIAYLEKELKI